MARQGAGWAAQGRHLFHVGEVDPSRVSLGRPLQPGDHATDKRLDPIQNDCITQEHHRSPIPKYN